jgi:hypothetical protein
MGDQAQCGEKTCRKMYKIEYRKSVSRYKRWAYGKREKMERASS